MSEYAYGVVATDGVSASVIYNGSYVVDSEMGEMMSSGVYGSDSTGPVVLGGITAVSGYLGYDVGSFDLTGSTCSIDSGEIRELALSIGEADPYGSVTDGDNTVGTVIHVGSSALSDGG